ncbi:hypothetical protein DIPPA_11171 [Diplonema papillatum]|nr:hypothetical protein DIPPA_11171 [Diplonema papillatum]
MRQRALGARKPNGSAASDGEAAAANSCGARPVVGQRALGSTPRSSSCSARG